MILGTRIGFHVSISGGISNSVDNAIKDHCTAFQIFTRNPRGWAAKPLDNEDIQLFKDKLEGCLQRNDTTKNRQTKADRRQRRKDERKG